MLSGRPLFPRFSHLISTLVLVGATRVAAQESPAAEAASEASAELEPVDEVSVEVGRVRRAPGSVHVLSREVLQRYKYDDPHATLQLVPGVYVRQEDGFGLRPNIGIRGALSDRSKKVALLEDGVLFGPAPYSAPAAYYFPIIGRMDQVNVVKGPSAVTHGPQSVGGAIELVTRQVPSETQAALDLAAGQFGYGKFHGSLGANAGQTAFLVEGVHLRSSGFKELSGDQDTGFARNEWMFKAEHSLRRSRSRPHKLSLKLTYSDEASNETYLGLTDEDFARNPVRRYAPSQYDRMKWHRTSLVARHEIRFLPNLGLTTTVYRHDLDRSWTKVNHFATASLFDVLSEPGTPRNTPFYEILDGEGQTTSPEQHLFIGPNQRSYVSQGIQTRLDADWQTGMLSHHVQVGARLHYDRIEREHSEDAFDVVGGNPSLAGTPTQRTTINRASTLALALHAIDEVRLGELTLTPGARVELMRSKYRDQLNEESEKRRFVSVVLAGLGAHYQLGSHFGVLAGAHRGMSPPAPGTEGSVKPEISINYEAGARYLDQFRRAEVIGYFNDYQNLTDICTLSGGCDEATLDEQFDAGRARIYGVEALAEDTLLFSAFRIPLSVSYTLTRTEFLETFQSRDPIFGDVEAGDELPYVPRHQARGSVGIELDELGGYVAGTFASAMREQSGAGPLNQTVATDALFSLDLGAHYRVTDALQLYGQVRNALNQQAIVSRRPYGARPNAPRWIQLGARIDLD